MGLPALPSVPLVSVVVTAYNVGRYIGLALDSALAVDWPQDRLEIIVVNDGSTDDTATVLDRYGDRITLFTQENQGCLGAMTTALRAVRGDVVAFLDGDDEWPRDKLRRQVPVLQERPEVGLVYGDLEVIDPEGAVMEPSFFSFVKIEPKRGRVLGSLLPASFVLTPSIVVRADLVERFCPIPPKAAAYDWYVACRVAEVAELDFVPGVVSRYRYRGDNLYLGANLERQGANSVRADVYIRYLLTHFDLSTVKTAQMMHALRAAEDRRVMASRVRGVDPDSLLVTSSRARATSRTEYGQASRLNRRGDLEAAMRAAVRAVAHDPRNLAATRLLAGLTSRVVSAAEELSESA